MGLSTHILDTHLGRPAANVAITLWHWHDNAWHQVGSALTDSDGRCRTLLGGHALAAADYKLHFEVGPYFRAHHAGSLYPYVEIVFTVADPEQHYHIPLLLAANGYTTYRGS
jgi:5-hydroxyisourate hydrolase